MRIHSVFGLALLALAACGNGGGGNDGTIDGGTDGGGGFRGQPGRLWVDAKRGDLIVIDTQDGRILKTAPAPERSALTAGGGMLWLSTSSTLVPFDPTTGALTPLGVKASVHPAFGAGKLWDEEGGFPDPVRAWSVAPPSTVTSQTVTDALYPGPAADSGGAYFLAQTKVPSGDRELVHCDPANAKVLWRASLQTLPDIGAPGSPLTAMVAAVGGKVILLHMKVGDPKTRYVTSIDASTGVVGGAVPLPVAGGDPDDRLITDGTSLWVLDNWGAKVLELDLATLAAKRTLALPARDKDQTDPPVRGAILAAGAIWLAHLDGGTAYVRRLDVATGALADVALPSSAGSAVPQSYAFLPP